MEFTVNAKWDDEAKVWVATSEDVPGLVTEAETIERLFEKLRVMIPELLEANGTPLGKEVEEIPVHIVQERVISLRH
jgi:predicted RNase H-like HicB family nuclease